MSHLRASPPGSATELQRSPSRRNTPQATMLRRCTKAQNILVNIVDADRQPCDRGMFELRRCHDPRRVAFAHRRIRETGEAKAAQCARTARTRIEQPHVQCLGTQVGLQGMLFLAWRVFGVHMLRDHEGVCSGGREDLADGEQQMHEPPMPQRMSHNGHHG